MAPFTVGDRVLQAEEAWSGEGTVTLKAGRDGATVWRWELVTGDADGGVPTGAGHRFARKAIRAA